MTANDYEAQLFSVTAGMGLLLIKGITYLDAERPVEYFKAVYRGDCSKLVWASQRAVWPMESTPQQRRSVVLRDRRLSESIPPASSGRTSQQDKTS